MRRYKRLRFFRVRAPRVSSLVGAFVAIARRPTATVGGIPLSEAMCLTIPACVGSSCYAMVCLVRVAKKKRSKLSPRGADQWGPRRSKAPK